MASGHGIYLKSGTLLYLCNSGGFESYRTGLVL